MFLNFFLFYMPILRTGHSRRKGWCGSEEPEYS